MILWSEKAAVCKALCAPLPPRCRSSARTELEVQREAPPDLIAGRGPCETGVGVVGRRKRFAFHIFALCPLSQRADLTGGMQRRMEPTSKRGQ